MIERKPVRNFIAEDAAKWIGARYREFDLELPEILLDPPEDIINTVKYVREAFLEGYTQEDKKPS